MVSQTERHYSGSLRGKATRQMIGDQVKNPNNGKAGKDDHLSTSIADKIVF